jgi:hypothetical protein
MHALILFSLFLREVRPFYIGKGIRARGSLILLITSGSGFLILENRRISEFLFSILSQNQRTRFQFFEFFLNKKKSWVPGFLNIKTTFSAERTSKETVT